MKGAEAVGMKSLRGRDVVPYLIEVDLVGDQDLMFRRVRETLERLGTVVPEREDEINQVCHLLHKQGKYYVTHYKFLKMLDGEPNTLVMTDIAIQNRVVRLLQGWNMISVVNIEECVTPLANMNLLKVLRHTDMDVWTSNALYQLGGSDAARRPEPVTA